MRNNNAGNKLKFGSAMTEGVSIWMLFLPQQLGCVTLPCLTHSWSHFQSSLPHTALLVTILLPQVYSPVKPTLVCVGQVSVCSSWLFLLGSYGHCIKYPLLLKRVTYLQQMVFIYIFLMHRPAFRKYYIICFEYKTDLSKNFS